MKRAPITESYEIEEQRSPAPLLEPFTDQEPVAKAAKPRNMAETSIEAYRERVLPHVGTKRHRVLEALGEFKSGATLEELAGFLHWPVHTVSPRLTELKRSGCIAVDRIKRGRSGKVQVYKAIIINV